MEEVDVIIPTYNNSELLHEAIDSCRRQTYSVRKIIVIDDGSSAAIKEALRSEYANDERIELIFGEHTGLPGVARQIGIKKAKAEWIAFLDSDDTWRDDKLEVQIRFAMQERADLVYSNATVFGDGIEPYKFLLNLPTQLNFRTLSKTNWIVNSSTLMKRSLFNEPFTYATSSRLRAVEDYATWLRLSTKFRLAGVDDTLINYRVSNQSIRSQDSSDPRIYALADFLEWSRANEENLATSFKLHRRQVLKLIRNEYV
jgi:teichuronic acid biosynthesis glycosyltransferase TuaG